MLTLEHIQVNDEVAEVLRREADAAGVTVADAAAARLAASVKPGIGTRMNQLFKEHGFEAHERIQEMEDDGFRIPDFSGPEFGPPDPSP